MTGCQFKEYILKSVFENLNFISNHSLPDLVATFMIDRFIASSMLKIDVFVRSKLLPDPEAGR